MERLAQWVTAAMFALVLASLGAVVLPPLWPNVHAVWTVAPGALVLLGLHRFLQHCETRGWIYYTKKRGSYGGLGVTSNFLNMYDPSRKHLQQTARMAEWKRAEDDDGDDPKD